ncbi:MAG: FtsQ-type POTRA domain-containing protein [Candidatus Manganitrophaceae bacterium]|nr:MAG: FtsQ-type POTRA domain-containing protein [Candidatus Manganitrophaceae bacterium]
MVQMKAIAIQRNKKRRSRLSWARWIGWLRPTFWSVLLGGSLFALYVGGQRLTSAPVFQVREIRWAGLHHLNETEMSARFRPVVGRNIFRVDIAQIQGALQANPWVKQAVVRKDFPDRLNIIVVERVPAVVEVESAQGPLLRDEAGEILERVGEASDRLGDGKAAGKLPRVIHYNPASYAKGLELASLLSRTLEKESIEPSLFLIDLADPEDLVVHFPEGVLHFGEGGYAERWERFLEIKEDLERRELTDREIDLRFERKVIVRGGFTPPRRGAGVVLAWPGMKEDRRGTQF